MTRLLEWEPRGASLLARGQPRRKMVAKAKAERRQALRALVSNPTEPASPAEAHAVDSAFAPGPRARALLRGKQIAERDLAESGGSYTLEDVRRLLNSVSRQSVEKRVREGTLLAITGPNNRRFYPVAQFHDDGSVVAGLREVQEAMATRNGYAVLNFLVNPDARLHGRTPLDLLKRGEVAKVVEAAAGIGEQS